MIKKNMPLIIITTLITMLPAILMKSGMPLICVAVHLLCIFATGKDKGNQEQSQKVFRLVLWLCPVISCYASAVTYMVTNGKYAGIEEVSFCLFGAMFIVIGNYLPKCKMNATIGIKIPWTYSSEENWRRTHRFGGKVWVICGLLMVCGIFLPANIAGKIMIGIFFVMIFVPVFYSYSFYRNELKEGKVGPASWNPARMYNKKMGKASTAIGIAILVSVGILMFVGDVEITCEEDALNIDANFWSDMMIEYDKIQSVEYLENDAKGNRVGGYSSAKLLMGTFRNDEYDYYTRYSYTKCDEGILLETEKGVVVLSGIDEEATKLLYEDIKEMIK